MKHLRPSDGARDRPLHAPWMCKFVSISTSCHLLVDSTATLGVHDASFYAAAHQRRCSSISKRDCDIVGTPMVGGVRREGGSPPPPSAAAISNSLKNGQPLSAVRGGTSITAKTRARTAGELCQCRGTARASLSLSIRVCQPHSSRRRSLSGLSDRDCREGSSCAGAQESERLPINNAHSLLSVNTHE